MAIEVFCRYANGATNAAERRVLQNTVEILEQNRHSAVILSDFFCGSQQIDLLVATEITTLVLQVKHYRHAVEGSANSAFWTNPATGEAMPNAYTQATNQMLALKDMLRSRTGADPGFARAIVLFEQGIPIGSSLPRSDFRVQICGSDRLEGLLLTSTSEHSARVPWDLDALRSYALGERMARLSEASLQRSAIRPGVTQPPRPPGQPQYVERTAHVIEVPVREVPPVANPRPIEQFAPRLLPEHAPTRPRQPRRTGRYLLALMATSVGLGWHYHRPAPMHTESTMANIPPHASMHRAPEPRRRRSHEARASAKPFASAPAATSAALVAAPVQPVFVPPVASPPPPCPAGIDRLGCTPSSETLARLRGQ
jgi:hypothetical protein